MPKLLNFKFPKGWYFLNCNNTELKRSSKINFSFSERHSWAVVGLKQKWRANKSETILDAILRRPIKPLEAVYGRSAALRDCLTGWLAAGRAAPAGWRLAGCGGQAAGSSHCRARAANRTPTGLDAAPGHSRTGSCRHEVLSCSF